MSWCDVQIMRLLQAASYQGYRVVQEIETRDICLLTASDDLLPLGSVAGARAWLREHIGCGAFARRCSLYKGAGLVITTH
ncbi:MAG: hypothetical protein NVSMB44_25620 [Ktedonobacteraceae bacterium]